MIAPQACVAVEITGSPAALEQRAALERRCSDILGAHRCRIILPGESEAASAACWRAVVSTEGGDAATEASVVLSDGTDPEHAPVRRDVTFRANDIVSERWATLGLVIAALVTVEEHSAAEETPATPWSAAGGGFAPAVDARHEAPAPATTPFLAVEARASAVAAIGLLPAAALGARVEVSVAHRWLALLVRATVFPEASRATFSTMGAGGDVQLASVGLGLCGEGGRGRWSGRGCLGGDRVRTRASGFGVSETTAASAWWESAWASAAVELGFYRHLALVLEADAALLLQRPTFAIHGAPTMFTSSPVAGTLALGIAVPF